MTSRQAKKVGDGTKQQRRRSGRVDHEGKTSRQLKGSTTANQNQPTNPQHFDQHSQTSQYQNTSSIELPPATTWPNGATIPSQTDMNYDLLGLTLNSTVTQPSSSPYDQTTQHHHFQRQTDAYPRVGAGAGAEAELYIPATPYPGYGMTVMQRWASEPASEQGALLAWAE